MRKILICTIILAGLVLLLKAAHFSYLHAHIAWFIAFVTVISVAGHAINRNGLANNGKNAFTYFTAGMMMRFFLSIIAILVYFLQSGQSKTQLIIAAFNFLIVYLFYTVVEINSFLTNLRQNSGHHTN